MNESKGFTARAFQADQLQAPALGVAQQAKDAAWTTTKPTVPGIYRLRGWSIGHPRRVAVVVVAQSQRELRCNLHESTSDTDAREWPPVEHFNPKFEWQYVAPEAQP